MRFLILANGSYGDLEWYRRQSPFDRVICADGGGAWAAELGIVPHWIIGDMDSIDPADLRQLQAAGTETISLNKDKDDTDTQAAMQLAKQEGASSVTLWGAAGTRLDHTMSNIFSASLLVKNGVAVRFESPGETIDIIKDTFVVKGSEGETVSLLVLGDEAVGVTLQGFKYPLNNAKLKADWQWAISNVIVDADPVIRLDSGLLAVIHYRDLPD